MDYRKRGFGFQAVASFTFFCLSLRIMLNYNMQSLAFSPIPEQNPIEAYGNMLHSDGFISVSGINRRKICRSRMNR